MYFTINILKYEQIMKIEMEGDVNVQNPKCM